MPQKFSPRPADEMPQSDPVASRVELLAALARDAGHAVSLDGHVDEACFAALVGLSPLTLRNRRTNGGSLVPFRQLGGRRGRVQYALRAIAEFLLASEQPL